MSEENIEAQEAPVTEEATAPEVAATPPALLKIHGKEFDVSTSEGRIHAQAWGEAISSLVGRQSQEVGELRKFASARKPSATEAELLASAKSKAAAGDVEGAIEQMFSYAKETETKAQEKLRIERENSDQWDSYFETRPELVKVFGKKTIKTVSENALDLYDQQRDAFQALDDFWKPKVSALTPSSQPAPTQKPKAKDVPPSTLSGGASRGTAKIPAPAMPELDFDAILAGVSVSAKPAK